MKKMITLLFLVATTVVSNAQKFNGHKVIHARVDQTTQVLKINGKPYLGTKDSLLAMYKTNLIPQKSDSLEIDLGVVKVTTRYFRKKFTPRLEISTFRKQKLGTEYSGQWLLIATYDGEIASITKAPERF